MDKKQKSKKKSDLKNNNQIREYLEESSILGNTLFIGFILFGIILIIFSIIYYFFQITSTFCLWISSFLISTIIAILYYTCQRKKKCEIRMIVNLKN